MSRAAPGHTKLRRRLLVAFGVGLAMDLAALALVVHTLIAHPTVPIYDYFLEGAIGGIALSAITLLLVVKRPDHRVTWALLVTSLFGSMQAILGTYAMEALVSAPGSLPNGEPALAASYVAQLWFVLSFMVMVNLFPTGRTMGGLWRVVPVALITDGMLSGLTTLTSPMELGDGSVPALLDVTVPAVLQILTIATVTIGIAGTIAQVIVRYLRSAGVERHQLKWFMYTFVTGVVVLFAPFTENDTFGAVLWTIVPTAILGSIALAILRYRLYEIDRIISRTVTYGLVVLLLGAAVAAIATLAGSRFQEPVVVAAVTLGVAAVFNPLRRRVQAVVDRRFNRSLFDAGRVMDDFAASLRDRVNPDEAVGGWTDVVSETMQPATLGVWIRG